MKEITIAVLKDCASRLMFDMTEEQYETLLGEFSVLREQMETIGKSEGLDDYEPMTFPFDCTTTYLRQDVPEQPLSREEALSNAKSIQDGQIKLPKVVDK